MKNKVIAFFKKNPGLLIKPKDLAQRLELENDYEYAQLKEILYQLTKENFLLRTGKRYSLNKKTTEKLTGNLQIIKDRNFGFVKTQVGEIFISEKFLETAFDGDTVEVSLFARKKGKNLEGQIIDIIKRKREEVVGTLHKTDAFYFVEPDDPSFHRNIYISTSKLKGAEVGDKVLVHNLYWQKSNLNPEGEIKDALGKAGSYDAEIASIALQFNLSYKFSKRVLKEAESIPDAIPQEEIKKRLDLRNKIIFTIDPKDAKDFDDAVSIEDTPEGNIIVGVHIADVSHFVKDGAPIYEEALKRGTSVYLVGKVIPMLPERLSNKICSLVPNEDRLTYSVLAELTPRGKVVSYEIKKSVINSKRRFTYEEVQKILETGKGDYAAELIKMNKLAKVMRQKRIKSGSINFFSREVEFQLDKTGKPVNISIKEVKESNNLIEEFMLMANQIVAGHVKKLENKNQISFVYRVHDLPEKEKIHEFARFVKSLGYSFDIREANNAKQFQKLFDEIEGTEEEAVINEVAIRSMAKAVYSVYNIGHYGLGFKNYTHFTSPIRRFPDLMVHKIIYEIIEKNNLKKYRFDELDDICNHTSAMERNAISAERLSVKAKQVEFLKDKIGESFHGVISGFTNFGFFVSLSQTLAEGLIRFRDLKDDFYILDEKNYQIVGKDTGKRIRLGDKVNVKILRVNEEKKEIDFALLSE
jgi:ribonuclease R